MSCSNGACFTTPNGCGHCRDKQAPASAPRGCGPRASSLDTLGVRDARPALKQGRPTPFGGTSTRFSSHSSPSTAHQPTPATETVVVARFPPEPVEPRDAATETVAQRPAQPVAPPIPLSLLSNSDALALMPPVAPAPIASVAPITSGSVWPSPPRNRCIPARYSPTGDPVPPPVLVPTELNGRLSQAEWAQLTPADRAGIMVEVNAGRAQAAQQAAEAARQRLLQGIGQGLSEAGRQVSALINNLNGHALDVRREDHSAEADQRAHQLAMYQAETQRALATLQAQQQNANASGNTAQSAQIAAMMQALQSAMANAQASHDQQNLTADTGMSTTTKALIAGAVVATAAGVAYVVLRRPRSNPSRHAPLAQHAPRARTCPAVRVETACDDCDFARPRGVLSPRRRAALGGRRRPARARFPTAGRRWRAARG